MAGSLNITENKADFIKFTLEAGGEPQERNT